MTLILKKLSILYKKKIKQFAASDPSDADQPEEGDQRFGRHKQRVGSPGLSSLIIGKVPDVLMKRSNLKPVCLTLFYSHF